MKTFALLFLLAVTSAAAFAAAKPEKQTITSQGGERTYYTFVPEKLTAPAPLLLLLHGSGRDGMSQIDEWKDAGRKRRNNPCRAGFGKLTRMEHEHRWS